MEMLRVVMFVVFGACILTPCISSPPTAANFLSWLNSDPFKSYNKMIFPRNASTDTVQVDVTFYLVAITDFNELGGNLEITGYLLLKWKTELLTWTTSDSAMQDLMISQNNFWRPSIVLSNSVESLKELGDFSYKIRIDRDGNQEWQVGVVSKTGCSVDVSYYPFDSQSCDVSYTPWGYTDTQVRSLFLLVFSV